MPPRFDFDAAVARHLEPYSAIIPDLERIRREQSDHVENTLRWRIQLNCPCSDFFEPALAIHKQFLLKMAAYNLPPVTIGTTHPDRYVYGAIVIVTEARYPGWPWPRGWWWDGVTEAELRAVVTEMCTILADPRVTVQATFPPDPPPLEVWEGETYRGADGRLMANHKQTTSEATDPTGHNEINRHLLVTGTSAPNAVPQVLFGNPDFGQADMQTDAGRFVDPAPTADHTWLVQGGQMDWDTWSNGPFFGQVGPEHIGGMPGTVMSTLSGHPLAWTNLPGAVFAPAPGNQGVLPVTPQPHSDASAPPASSSPGIRSQASPAVSSDDEEEPTNSRSLTAEEILDRTFDGMDDPSTAIPLSSDPVTPQGQRVPADFRGSPAQPASSATAVGTAPGAPWSALSGATLTTSQVLMPPPPTTTKITKNTAPSAVAATDQEKMIPCPQCKEMQPGRKALWYHVKAIHEQEVKVLCKGWSKPIGVKRQSTKKKNGEDVNAYHCPKCDKTYETSQTLQRHAKACPGTKPEPGTRDEDAPPTITLDLIDELWFDDEDEGDQPFEKPNNNQMTPWAARSGFMTLLDGEQLKDYVAAIDLPKKGTDTAEGHLCDLAASALREAAEKLNSLPTHYAQLMNAKDKSKIPVTRPMNAQPTTLANYIKIIQRLCLFCVRVLDADEDLGKAQDTEDAPSPLAKVRAALQQDTVLRGKVVRLSNDPDKTLIWEIGEHLLSVALPDDVDGSVLSFFLAAIAIKRPVNGTFISAGAYTPFLSQLLYCLRLCWFWHHARYIIRSGVNANQGPEAKSASQQISALHTSKLGPDADINSGGNAIQSLRAFGMATAKAEGGKDTIMWSADGQTVAVAGHWVKLQDVKTMMKDAITTAEQQLKTLLARAKDQSFLANFDFAKVVDKPSQDEADMWFGSMASNEDHLDLRSYSNQVLPTILSLRKDVGLDRWMAEPDWDKVQRLWDEENDFLKSLLVAVHITSGMPSRGSELLETTWRNDYGTRLRNVLAGHDGEILLDSTYSKTEYKSTRIKQNLRFLHPRLANIMAIYLSTVRQTTDRLFRRKHKASRNYLWCNVNPNVERRVARWDTTILSRELTERATRAHVGKGLNVSQFRQLIEAVAHKHFRTGRLRQAMSVLFPAESTKDNEDDNLDDLTLLGLDGYSDDVDDIADAAADHMAGLGPGRHGHGQDPFSAQSGRSDETSWIHYARQKIHRAGMDEGVISNARVASRVYQAFFGLFGATAPAPTPSIAGQTHTATMAPAVPSLPATPTPAATTPVLPMSTITPLPQTPTPVSNFNIRAHTGTLSTGRNWFAPPFDGFQGRRPLSPNTLKAVLSLTKGSAPRRPLPLPISDTLAIMGQGMTNVACIVKTNGGKSLLWQVDATLGRKDIPSFSLLVVPYLSLIDDIKRVCTEKGIKYALWNEPFTIGPNGPQIVIVSLSRTYMTPFLQWVADPEIQAALRRVFVDEAHVLFDELFRKDIEDFAKIPERLPNKQFVYLSATIPPACEESLERATCMPIRFLREGTNRENIAYSLVDVTNEAGAMLHIRDAIERLTTGPNQGRQALIICRDKPTVRRVAKALGCPGYYSTEDPKERLEMEENMSNFKARIACIMVATYGAGTGIDYEALDFVAILGHLYSMAAALQATGRAGRRGQRAEAHFYNYINGPQTPEPDGIHPRSDDDAVGMLFAGKRCLRQPISQWLDGRIVSCIDLAAEWCSVCTATYDGAPEPTKTVRDGKRRLIEPAEAQPPAKRNMVETPPAPSNKRHWPLFNSFQSPFLPASSKVKKARIEEPTGTTTPRPFARKQIRPASSPDYGPPGQRKLALADRPPTPRAWPMQDGASQPSSSAESSSSGGQVDSPSAYKAPQYPVVMRPLSERVPVFKSPHAGASGTSSPYPRKVNRWSPSTHSPARVAITYFHNGITNHARKIFPAILKANLRMTDTNCPMCCAVQRDEMHKPAKCPMKDVNLGAQIEYREDNTWTAPLSCWTCGLPDAYCNCEKKGGTEPSQRTRDAVRGILLLLTHNEDVRDEAVSYAQGMYNPEYTLGPPRGPGLLAPEWQETVVFMNDIKVYRAFPAVAAVLIMMNDIAVNGTTVEWEE